MVRTTSRRVQYQVMAYSLQREGRDGAGGHFYQQLSNERTQDRKAQGRGLTATKPQDANELGAVEEQKGLQGKSARGFKSRCGDVHLKSSPVWAEGRGKSAANSTPAGNIKG